MIKILNSNFERLAIIKDIISSNRYEEINGENTLDFTAILTEKNHTMITEDSIMEYDDDYFDIAYLRKSLNADGTYTIEVQAEHVSYRLNNSTYNVDYFTEYGYPNYILTKVLEDTEIQVGDVEFYDLITYSAQEAKSRRQLLMELASYIGAEIKFEKFKIDLVQHIGSTEAKNVVKGKNISVISKAVDKRNLNEDGEPTISYECTPISLSTDTYLLGDEILLLHTELGIKEELRVVSINKDVMDDSLTTLQFSKYVDGLASSLYQIETSSVSKDANYNGVRIGPEYGFEAVRNDNLARAYFRSDRMAFQSGDGSGTTWKDRLYYDYNSDTDETVLVFDGKLSADVITAVSAVITPNLYAEKGTISELTVDQLDTSTKIQNYLNEIKSDVNYIKIIGQTIQFITAIVSAHYQSIYQSDGFWDMVSNEHRTTYYTSINVSDTNGSITYSNGLESDAWSAYNAGRIYCRLSDKSFYKLTKITSSALVYYDVYEVMETDIDYEHVKNRNGSLLYWTDSTFEIPTTEETDYPTYSYIYNENVKMEYTFCIDPDSGEYVPSITLGAGTGNGSKSKGYIRKLTDGVYIDYYTSDTGELRRIALTDNGVIITPLELESISFDDSGFDAKYTGSEISYLWEKDAQGRITELRTLTGEKIPINWG
ncbi:MAG: prophage endopeptidase tail family protein [Clostridia bacterium]